MDVFGFHLAVVAPAFPFYGRTTTNGRHFLNGIPLAQTEFANDPRSPVVQDDLVRLFSSQSKRKVGLVELGTLRSGTVPVSKKIESFYHQGIELAVFDAQVEGDLDRIVETVSSTGYRVLWVGSTGLARCIPKLLTVEVGQPLRTDHPSSTQVMVVSGSVSEVTHRQLDTLRAVTGILVVEMNPLEIIDPEKSRIEMKRCLSELENGLNGGGDVVLRLRWSGGEVAATKAKGREIGMEETEVSMRIADALAVVTNQIVNVHELRGLILTGGDTAKKVCTRLGGSGIDLLKEVEAGIAMGRLVGTRLFVVTKAGGFGTPYSLVNSIRMLKLI
jgi:uncharacterized protein YgbK (DUF1537 family)